MSDTTIYLLRHAQAIPQTGLKNRDWTLSDAGRIQSEALAKYLETLPIEAVYCSPFIRARQTLTPYVRDTDLKVRAHPGLVEHDFAPDCLTSDEYRAHMENLWNDTFHRADVYGETGADVQSRVMEAIREVGQEHKGQTVLMCSHAQPIAWALRRLDVNYTFEDWVNMPMPAIFRLIYGVDGCISDPTYTHPSF